MYELVADIESYPEFLPWCSAARVRSRARFDDVERVDADLVISFKAFRERFRSLVDLDPASLRIRVSYLDGPLEHLESRWDFTPIASDGCVVEFNVEFRFKTGILNSLARLIFHHVTHRVVHAFEKRAMEIYG